MMNSETPLPSGFQVDFSGLFRVDQNGRIWWRLIDAVKLGAGFRPVRDDEQSLVPKLYAANNRILAGERDLLSEFSHAHYGETHPQLTEHGGERFVEAQEFLDWLARYLAATPASSIVFPQELARAVRDAKMAPVLRAAHEPEFKSLELALEGWFVHALIDVPDALRARVEREFFPIRWDDLAETQRISLARQYDDRNDPALEPVRKFWWEFTVRKDALELEISKWIDTAARTAGEMAERTDRLASLNKQLEVMRRQERSDELRVKRLGRPERVAPVVVCAPMRYVAYPKAAAALAKRLKATPDEIAIWIYLGPKLNGIKAFLNGNELDPPARFHYGVGVGNERDFDYVAPLMACRFDEDEIATFPGTDRYVTGQALLEDWRAKLGVHAEAFISAKVRGGDLDDLHPITGGTQASSPGNDAYPPITSGLFSVSQISAIEAEDFPVSGSEPAREPSGLGATPSPVTAQQIRLNFAVLRDYDANAVWWREKMSHAKANKLVGSRVGEAKRGQGSGTMWRPDLVAGWLLNRLPEDRCGMTEKSIRTGLSKFAGYEQAAGDLLIDGD